jgi:hypothetical protein
MIGMPDTDSRLLYSEELTSPRTTVFFAALVLFFSGLAAWRWRVAGAQPLVWFQVFLALFFLFYTINFRVLFITITSHFIRLKFGLFAWRTPLKDIERAYPDQLDIFHYYGGAGLHFMVVRGRYRASFNFLEHPRVALALRHSAGLVREISFSTRQPQEIVDLVTRLAAAVRGKQPHRRK